MLELKPNLYISLLLPSWKYKVTSGWIIRGLRASIFFSKVKFLLHEALYTKWVKKLKIFQLISGKRLATNRCFNSCMATAKTVTSNSPWAFLSEYSANKVVSTGHRALIYWHKCRPEFLSTYFQSCITSSLLIFLFAMYLKIFTQLHLYHFFRSTHISCIS